MVCGMKISGLWASIDPETHRPVLRSDLGSAEDPELKAKIGRYLQSGKLILRSPGLEVDYLQADAVRRVPIAFYTDGEWIWSGQQEYYLQEHNVLPDSAFVEHMQTNKFVAPSPSTEAIHEAKRLLAK